MHTITIVRRGVNYVITIGDNKVTINGTKATLDDVQILWKLK